MRERVEGSLPTAGVWVVLLGLCTLPTRLAGGQLQGSERAPATQQQQAAPQTKGQRKQTFKGKIMRAAGRLILKDDTSGSTYQLDDQQLAVFFEGKEVKVTGTLDAKDYTIYISDMGLSNAKHASTKTNPQPHKTATPVWYGLASWYGRDNQGPRTANGEPFDDQRLTAAHRRLPLGARVRVTNLRNGRSVVVRVNDRGPFTPGRLIDLSKGAAQQLGFIRQGLAHVRISVVGVPLGSPMT